jgi:hypothetical protein
VNLPTALDPAVISRSALKDFSLRTWNNIDNFEDAGLDWLAGEKVDWDKRRALLQRLQRPDVAGLPAMIVEDLMVKDHPADFGTYAIHRQLALAQLDEVLTLKPDLLNHTAFVNAYIAKLQPGADDDWKRDRAITRAYLERLQKFADRLDPVHNPLKAHVQFHRLAFDRAGGVYDSARFMAYVRLPRFQPYMNIKFGERPECQRHPAHLNADYTSITLLPPVGSDESLVRSYLTTWPRVPC